MITEALRVEDIRTGFEQKVLPLQFYFLGKKWIPGIKKDPGEVYDILADMFQMVGMKCPYRREEFRVNFFSDMEGIEIVQVVFPEPTSDMMCRCAYFVHDRDYRYVAYYTYELSYGEYYLTEWKVRPFFINDDTLGMKPFPQDEVPEIILENYHSHFAPGSISNTDLLQAPGIY